MGDLPEAGADVHRRGGVALRGAEGLEGLRQALARTSPPTPIDTVELLGEGDFCIAHLVNGHLVVREAKHAEAAGALGREVCLLGRISGLLPVAVPRPWILRHQGRGGPLLAAHELVPGEALTGDRWSALPLDQQEHCARELGKFFARLHTLEEGAVEGCGLGVLDHPSRILDLEIRLRASDPGAADGLVSLRRPLLEALERLRALDLRWTEAPVLLNGDVSPEHVLFDVTTGRISGILDWGDAMMGDPARDFIFLYEDWPRDFLPLVLEGYGAREDGALHARILIHYLADQLEWTLEALARGRPDEVEVGMEGLGRGLADLRVTS